MSASTRSEPKRRPLPRATTMQRLLTRTHVALYRLSGGAMGGRMGKSRVLLLTTTGRKSGKQRTTPVLYLADGTRWIIFASSAGAPVHPSWWINLQAYPHAQMQIGRKIVQATATQVNAEDRTRLWPRLVAMYPHYLDYAKKTSREFPLVSLTPVK